MLHPIAGKPLIQRVWERCQQARQLHRVIVATDETRIAETSRVRRGGRHDLAGFPERHGPHRRRRRALDADVSHVINIQGDEPTISPALIDRLASMLQSDSTLEMVTAASVLTEPDEITNPNCVKVVLAKNGDALYFSRSVIPHPFGLAAGADPGVVYHRHQGIYGYERKFLARFVRWEPSAYERAERLEQLRALENGARIRVFVTDHVSLGVDSPEDVARVEARLAAEARG